MIHFVTCRLRKQVHVPGQGFTNVLYLYTWGHDSAEAELHAAAFLAGEELEIEQISPARPALNQSMTRFTYPEQIYGLPVEMAEQELRSRDYPAELLQCSMDSLKAKQRIVRRGLEKLLVAV